MLETLQGQVQHSAPFRQS